LQNSVSFAITTLTKKQITSKTKLLINEGGKYEQQAKAAGRIEL
jgi:hypothetical protein